ncbi:MAG: agmatine deiminase family protein [Bacteroidota bacterium]
MITDAETNFVFFSGLLQEKPKYQDFNNRLMDVLKKHSISYSYLPGTRDIWCRDYMPVQVEKERFIEYRYDPDYLLNLIDRPSKTYPDMVCASIGLKTVKSDLILDGGNVIRWKDKVILTDKVIQENAAHYHKAELLKKLEEAFQVDRIILIPWYTKEEFGHADGMLRFVDGNTVLVDGFYQDEKSGMDEKLFRVLKDHRLEAVPLEFKVEKESNRNWGYLNFLQMEKLLLVPQFGIEEDLQALDQIRKLFPDYTARGQMDTIDAGALIRQGGVLNCASWSIRK